MINVDCSETIFFSPYTMYVVQGHLHASIRHTDICTLLLGYGLDALTYTKLYVVHVIWQLEFFSCFHAVIEGIFKSLCHQRKAPLKRTFSIMLLKTKAFYIGQAVQHTNYSHLGLHRVVHNFKKI